MECKFHGHGVLGRNADGEDGAEPGDAEPDEVFEAVQRAAVGALERMDRARLAIASSRAAMAPPPKHGMFFPSAKLNTPISPKVPTCCRTNIQ